MPDAGGDLASGVPELAPVGDSATISTTTEVFALEEGMAAFPGPWSPDGESLAAFVAVGESNSAGPLVRVFALAVPGSSDEYEPAPPWDSGDVQDELARADGLAAWDAGGNLVLPRSDGMRVAVDNGAVQDSEALDGQPREIVMAPDRRTVFAYGPEGAWTVDGSGRIRVIEIPAGERIEAASWRADSAAIALAGRAGAYYVADAATGTVQEIADAPVAQGPASVPAPRWLADGRVLLSGATWVGHGRQHTLDHRVVDPDGEPGATVAGMLDLPPSPAVPVDAEQWASPDGSWLVYPEIVSSGEAGVYEHATTWLLGTRRGEKIALPPLVDPLWSPDSARIAYRSDGGLSVWHGAEGARRSRVAGIGAKSFSWSPDGRWITYADGDGSLWLVASDGSAGPELLAERVRWDRAPTWAPTSDRIAVAAMDEAGKPSLLAIYVGIEKEER
jgi:hypothetical protein